MPICKPTYANGAFSKNYISCNLLGMVKVYITKLNFLFFGSVLSIARANCSGSDRPNCLYPEGGGSRVLSYLFKRLR